MPCRDMLRCVPYPRNVLLSTRQPAQGCQASNLSRRLMHRQCWLKAAQAKQKTRIFCAVWRPQLLQPAGGCRINNLSRRLMDRHCWLKPAQAQQPKGPQLLQHAQGCQPSNSSSSLIDTVSSAEFSSVKTAQAKHKTWPQLLQLARGC
jgi:hypothetical protein